MAEDLGGGVTRRMALTQARRATNDLHDPTIDPPPMPACLQHVSDWCLTLLPQYQRRGVVGAVSSAALVSEIEIQFGVTPNMFEINLLQEIFDLFSNTSSTSQRDRK